MLLRSPCDKDAFWWSYQSDLVRISRDEGAIRNGYSTGLYLDVLEDQLPGLCEQGLSFTQDNAPIYTAGKIREFVQEWGIIVLPFPLYSLDLNPIEHLWKKLKELAYELEPDLKESNLPTKEKMNKLYATLERAWHIIGGQLMKALVHSMYRRVWAVIKAYEWYTKY